MRVGPRPVVGLWERGSNNWVIHALYISSWTCSGYRCWQRVGPRPSVGLWVMIDLFMPCTFPAGHAVGAGAGRGLGHAPQWVYEGERGSYDWLIHAMYISSWTCSGYRCWQRVGPHPSVGLWERGSNNWVIHALYISSWTCSGYRCWQRVGPHPSVGLWEIRSYDWFIHTKSYTFPAGHAVGTGAGRGLGHAPQWVYEREGVMIDLFMSCTFPAGHAVGTGAGRGLGHTPQWVYEREGVPAVSTLWLSPRWYVNVCMVWWIFLKKNNTQ